MKMIETASRFLCGFVVIWLFGMAAVQATEAVTYYHLDATGSPVAATNSSGTLLWRERYYPYGERLKTDTAAAASTNRVWYTQHVEDNDAGLIYFGARWYNPQIGRFMSMDPVGVDLNNVHSFNRYAYANNNPYKYTDPDGRLPFLIPLIWGANAAWTAYNTYSTYQSEGAGAAAQSFVVDVGIGVATGGAATIFRGAAQVAKGVANEVPSTLARVVPGNRTLTTLGRPGAEDVFVTAADDIAGLNAAQLSKRLTIDPSDTFTVIRFPTPSSGLATPINRLDIGFIGGGRTAGGAREFVLPNQPIPPGATIGVVQ